MFTNDKVDRDFSMIPFGLLCLSIAVLLMGLSVIFQSATATAPYFTMALLFGGIGECVAGMWAFAYRESVVATAFSSLGLFYVWFGLTHLLFLGGGGGVEAVANVTGFSMGMVFVIGGVLSLYLWLLCSNQTSGLSLTLLFLWISFSLLAISFFRPLGLIRVVGGIFALTAAAIAAIASFIELHRLAGLGELPTVGQLAKKAGEGLVEKVGPVDELAWKARRTLADRIRPNDKPGAPNGSGEEKGIEKEAQ